METKFSVTLNSADLNDFIAPSQICTKPPLPNNNTIISKHTSFKVAYDEYKYDTFIEQKLSLEPVQISLSDCLACSGCITSAESILVNKQRPSELYDILRNGEGSRVVVSISNQVLASFAAKYSTSCNEISKRICGFFKMIGVHSVLDLNFSSDLALILSHMEFIQSPCLLLASSCPGWICYAEKMHSYMLPYISKVKSSQQIAGSLIKRFIFRQLNSKSIIPSQIYHVTIMSCYDKKLEASRSDFYDDILKTKDVDCVLTSGELESMILESGYNLLQIDPLELDTFKLFPAIIGSYIPSDNESGSGGCLIFIMDRIMKSLDNQEYHVLITEKGKDYKEYQLIHKESQEMLYRFIFCYGFKNMQNLLRRIKGQNDIPTFIEIMACPSGCLNGGGQLTTNETSTRIGSREFLKKIETAYYSLPTINPQIDCYIQLLEEWFEKDFLQSEEFQKCMYTSYHPIEITLDRISTQW